MLPGIAFGLAASASACGDVQFVPSPHAPSLVEVLYAPREDVSVIRWRTASSDPLREAVFEIAGADGYRPVDFSQSVFPGGVAPCGDGHGSCAQIVLPGRFPAQVGDRPVRARHAHQGVLAGSPVGLHTLEQTLVVEAFFEPGNAHVHTLLHDVVGGDGSYVFPRAFERALWVSNGLCVPDEIPSEARFEEYSGQGFSPPGLLDELGLYCLAVRPVRSDGGPGAALLVRLATLPEITPGSHVYRPEVETTPIVYQLVLDLEIRPATAAARRLTPSNRGFEP